MSIDQNCGFFLNVYLFMYLFAINTKKRSTIYISHIIIQSSENRSLGRCGNVAKVTKAPFISYSYISYFCHACLKINFVFNIIYMVNAQHVNK